MPQQSLTLRIACITLWLGLICQVGFALPTSNDWRVTSILRTVELGGSVTIVSDAHKIRAPANAAEPSSDEQVRPYYFAYSQSDAGKLSSLEVMARFGAGVTPKQRSILAVTDEGPLDVTSDEILQQYLQGGNESTSARPHLYSVRPPASFLRRDHPDEPAPDITLMINALMLHTSTPLPASVGQKDDQFLLWTGDAAPIAIYEVEKATVKVKSPHPRILSHTSTPPLPADQMSKSGATITYGPYERVPSILGDKANQGVAKAQVHYLFDSPVISFVEATRAVTISHWSNLMSVEDQFWLRNDGAALKGHFSRIDHQMTAFLKRDNSHVLTNMIIHLPPGTRDAYFVDQAGNVSTSNFRSSSPSPAHIATSPHLLPSTRASVLDLKPRYPILGGWNYSFGVGWNVRLVDGWQTSSGSRYRVQVPFMTPVTDVAVDQASIKIVLPEGARDIQVKTPFAVDEQSRGTKWHFMDTTGSPVIELKKVRCSEKHGGQISIEYTLSPLDHYRKIFVGLILIALGYVGIAAVSSVDLRIKG